MSDKLISVKIRMYRQGFGDCFLLTFNYENNIVKRIMIDFGVLMGSEGATKMDAVAQNILDETGSKIDVLVVTHEHWDHFSGFTKNQAQDIIKKLTFDKLWLAWTEDGKNEIAKELKKRKKIVKDSIKTGLLHMASNFDNLKNDQQTKFFYDKNTTAFAAQLNNVVELLAFEGEDDTIEEDTKASFDTDKAAFIAKLAATKIEKEAKKKDKSPENDDLAIDGLVGILSKVWQDAEEKTVFQDAGKIIELPWAGVRIYALGPPHEWDYIRRNESATSGELYLSDKIMENSTDFNLKNPNTFMNSFLFADNSKQNKWSDENIPFDENWASYSYKEHSNEIKLTPVNDQVLREKEQQRVIESIKNSEAFKLYNSQFPLNDNEKDNNIDTEFNAIRRIDFDYLSFIEPLAMKLNTHTNNTSLALAIEMIDSGKVLLFPGDAQYGNWLSWTEKKLAWEVLKDGKKVTVTVEDLLARTVFYKVSHHGSHNGTPQNKGLELMKDCSLIAAIPVDKKAAEGKKWHKIPYENIVKKLEIKTKKINGLPAILRSDQDFPKSDEISGYGNLYFDVLINN